MGSRGKLRNSCHIFPIKAVQGQSARHLKSGIYFTTCKKAYPPFVYLAGNAAWNHRPLLMCHNCAHASTDKARMQGAVCMHRELH
eukprot:356243-Chlamydomonas_euryale.AAC.7